jgi:hypothetical protein
MKSIILLTISACVFTVSGCSTSRYQARPEKLTLGFPIWFGGPSMTWVFEEKETVASDRDESEAEPPRIE